MQEEVVYLTEEGKRDLEAQLDELINVQRPALAERLHFAIKQGDLSENADYTYAKEQQAFMEGRMLELKHKLRYAVLIDPNGPGDGRIGLGSEITVVEDGYDDRETYYLVGPTEADPSKGKISHESPLGRALMAHKKGDTISVAAPAGKIRFKIIKVK